MQTFVRHQHAAQRLLEAEQALRIADPAAVPVFPRIVRRVIKELVDIPALQLSVPHRQAFAIDLADLLRIVDADELDSVIVADLPEKLILLARPDELELPGFSTEQLKLRYWRLLFHMRVHAAYDRLRSNGQLKTADVRRRIHEIGEVAFDEAHAVLRHESLLLYPDNRDDVFVEFAASFLELRFFSPHWLRAYFPSLEDFDRVASLLARDLNADEIFSQTRPPGTPTPEIETSSAAHAHITTADDDENSSGSATIAHHGGHREPVSTVETRRSLTPSSSAYRRLMRAGERTASSGNAVRAAFLFTQAERVAPEPSRGVGAADAVAQLDSLANRLRAALELSADEVPVWRAALGRLLVNGVDGFWNADARLLYDLQKVCSDHERVTYRVDPFGWIFSLFRQPIKHPLPNQREVQMSRHLRSAAQRLYATRLNESERMQWEELLHIAAESAELQLRRRIRPLIIQSLTNVELLPQNVPERVAWNKLVDELCDAVVERGFFTIGQVRDAVSRNWVKLDDLSGVAEFWSGDKLLKANRQLSNLLDGVYQPAEFYLRWLQRISALAFGTQPGRWATKHLAIPFGGAYFLLAFLDHSIVAPLDHFTGFGKLFGLDHHIHLEVPVQIGPNWLPVTIPATTLLLGLFLHSLLHYQWFRDLTWKLLVLVYRGLRGIILDAPRYVLRFGPIREFLLSTPVVVFRRYVLFPLMVTLLLWLTPAAVYGYPRPPVKTALMLLVIVTVCLNSRLERDLEELTLEYLGRAWHRIRVQVFVALYEAIIDLFRRLQDWLDKILYTVDEWLRFRSGESYISLLSKCLLWVVWSVVSFLLRFMITLFIEPQINPLKHFPWVTVSHKMLLPLIPVIAQQLAPQVGKERAVLYVTSVIWLVPGIFGFLVWELKENWKLYRANRSRRLEPGIVGSHGETLIRLLKPGFHSGTLPRLFGRLRRTERNTDPARRQRLLLHYQHQLHHHEIALRRFLERELVVLLDESAEWRQEPISIGEIVIASNSLSCSLRHGSDPESRAWLVFQEQSGWLVAHLADADWIGRLDTVQIACFERALTGLYKISGVDLVREQIEACFLPAVYPYDIASQCVVIWPDGKYNVQIEFDLHQKSTLRPKPRAVARSLKVHDVPALQLIFGRHEVAWDDWVAAWSGDTAATSNMLVGPPLLRLTKAPVIA